MACKGYRLGSTLDFAGRSQGVRVQRGEQGEQGNLPRHLLRSHPVPASTVWSAPLSRQPEPVRETGSTNNKLLTVAVD